MSKYASFGAKLEYETAPDTWQEVAQVTSVKPPSLSRKFIDVPTHDTTGGYVDRIGSGLKSGGEVEVDLYLDAAAASHHNGYAANSITKLFEDGTVGHWAITLPGYGTAQYWLFDAVIINIEQGPLTVDNEQIAHVVFATAGKPTLTTTKT